VLSCGNKEALAVAKACSFDFIRAEGFVFGHIGDEGYTDANAGRLLRYRKHIEAENVLIFADIKKKHRLVLKLLNRRTTVSLQHNQKIATVLKKL